MSRRAALAVLVWTAGCEKAGEERPPPAPVRPSDAAPRPAPTPADAGTDERRAAARALVRQGFDPRDDMVQLLVEVYSGEGKQVSVATARRLVDQAIRRGRKVRGYTFFHDQDTEGALDGELYLAYASVKEGDPALVAIGHEVASALRAEGLAVEWNGDGDRRVLVRLQWRKRRFTRAPKAGR